MNPFRWTANRFITSAARSFFRGSIERGGGSILLYSAPDQTSRIVRAIVRNIPRGMCVQPAYARPISSCALSTRAQRSNVRRWRNLRRPYRPVFSHLPARFTKRVADIREIIRKITLLQTIRFPFFDLPFSQLWRRF